MNNNFGYPSDKPCEICGKFKNNQSEPRFGYTVCEDHQSVPPNQIHKLKYQSIENKIKKSRVD